MRVGRNAGGKERCRVRTGQPLSSSLVSPLSGIVAKRVKVGVLCCAISATSSTVAAPRAVFCQIGLESTMTTGRA